MGAGQHEAIGGQHTCAASAIAEPRPDPQARHARQDPLDHRGHRGGVGIHRLTVTLIRHVEVTRTGQKCSQWPQPDLRGKRASQTGGIRTARV